MDLLAAASVSVTVLCLLLSGILLLYVVTLGQRLQQCVDSQGTLREHSLQHMCEKEASQSLSPLIQEDGADYLRSYRKIAARVGCLHEQLRCSTDVILRQSSEMEQMVERLSDLENQLRNRRTESAGGRASTTPIVASAADESSVCTPEIWRNNSRIASPSSICQASTRSSVEGGISDVEPPTFSPVTVQSPPQAGLQDGKEMGEERPCTDGYKESKEKEDEERTRAFLVGYLTQKRIDRLSRRCTNETRALPCLERPAAVSSDDHVYRTQPCLARMLVDDSTSSSFASPEGCDHKYADLGASSHADRAAISSPVVASLAPKQISLRNEGKEPQCYVRSESTSMKDREAFTSYTSPEGTEQGTNDSSTNSTDGRHVKVGARAGDAPNGDLKHSCGHGMDSLMLASQRATPLHMIKVRADIGFVDEAMHVARSDDVLISYETETSEESNLRKYCNSGEGCREAISRPRVGTENGKCSGIDDSRTMDELTRSGAGAPRSTLPLLEVSEGLCSPGRGHDEDETDDTPFTNTECLKSGGLLSREKGPLHLPKTSRSWQDARQNSASEHLGVCQKAAGQGAGDWYVADLQIIEGDFPASPGEVVCITSDQQGSDEQGPEDVANHPCERVKANTGRSGYEAVSSPATASLTPADAYETGLVEIANLQLQDDAGEPCSAHEPSCLRETPCNNACCKSKGSISREAVTGIDVNFRTLPWDSKHASRGRAGVSSALSDEEEDAYDSDYLAIWE